MALPLLLRAELWLIAPVFLSQPWEGPEDCAGSPTARSPSPSWGLSDMGGEAEPSAGPPLCTEARPALGEFWQLHSQLCSGPLPPPPAGLEAEPGPRARAVRAQGCGGGSR